ncbi:MAG TPA: SAM-dependent chlorinase/fluorinase [Candidatus Dormibacteraeota bacterium]|nr:SAM-dependent chlorinase/fluorinase [Candidatus Dormibacteraeota bacterium]
MSKCTPSLTVFLPVLLGLACVGCAPQSPREGAGSPASHRSRATIVFMSDFGAANDAVAICKAVMVAIAPDARLMDITHQVTPFSIEEAARFLAAVSPYYPAGTVFLAVVDPGVGTSRKPIIVKTKKGQYFVVPDNGLMTPVSDRDGIEAIREITNTSWMLAPVSAASPTFHGRDIFSPVAAHLAAGWDWTQAGPIVSQLVRLAPKLPRTTDAGIQGEIVALDDPYGSLITNIPAEDFHRLGYSLGDKIALRVANKSLTVPFLRTFMDTDIAQPLLYIDSRGRVGLALNHGNFSKTYKILPPANIFIPLKPEQPAKR